MTTPHAVLSRVLMSRKKAQVCLDELAKAGFTVIEQLPEGAPAARIGAIDWRYDPWGGHHWRIIDEIERGKELS